MKLVSALLIHYYVIMFAFDSSPAKITAAHTFVTFVKVAEGKIVDKATVSWRPTEELVPYGPAVPGSNWSLAHTLRYASENALTVSYWEPLEIEPALFDLAKARVARLGDEVTDTVLFDADGGETVLSAISAANIVEPRAFGLLAGRPASKAVLEHFGMSVPSPLVPHPEILDGLPRFKGERQEVWKLKMRAH